MAGGLFNIFHLHQIYGSLTGAIPVNIPAPELVFETCPIGAQFEESVFMAEILEETVGITQLELEEAMQASLISISGAIQQEKQESVNITIIATDNFTLLGS